MGETNAARPEPENARGGGTSETSRFAPSSESARRLAFYETLNTVCWVTLDVGWFFESELVSILFAAPTIVTCLAILRYTEKEAVALLVSGAVTFWAGFNVFWVLADMELLGWGMSAAKVCIALLAACLIGALAGAAFSNEARLTVLARLRRVRIGMDVSRSRRE